MLLSTLVVNGEASGCSGEPSNVPHAVKSGSGMLVGNYRTFTCSGDSKWEDDDTGGKKAYCQADGTWSPISINCLRMLNSYQNFSPFLLNTISNLV